MGHAMLLHPQAWPYWSSLLTVTHRQDVPLITFLSKRPAALNAAETLWVPVLIQSGDHFLNNKGMKSLMAQGGLGC